MKSFWKTALAAGVGVILVSIILGILSSMLLGSIVAAAGSNENGKTTVEPNSVLDIDFERIAIAEQSVEASPFANLGVSPQAGLSAQGITTIGILDAVRALEEAAIDPNVKFVYIRPDMAGNVSNLEEFRTALVKFRTSGKPIIAYIQTPTNAGYYLASAADRIYVSEYHGGFNQLVGLSGRLVFLKDLLDKLGVNIQLIRHGKYKSAGETFIRNSASKENYEQTKVMVDNLWKAMVEPMAGHAGMSVEEFNAMIDNLELVDASDFVAKGLADEAVTLDGMKSKLCAQAGEDDYDNIKSIGLGDYARIKVKKNFKTRDKIAVVYVDGEIVDGRGSEEVAGKRFADIIDEVCDDEEIKAVVLRVNSPGGSVIAASQIKNAVDRLCASKPTIASYGGYAASGGYWISAGCKYIFSDATTLTGSIGVFGIVPDFGGTAKDILHINVTAVPSNKHSDMLTFMRPLTDEEVKYVQKDIEYIYNDFVGLVAEGRNMDVALVDELGQGRVWTGSDAVANGLVDRIGGLADALEYAATEAGCPEYRLVSYPKPLTQMEQLLASFKPANDDYLVGTGEFGKGLSAAIKEISSIKEAKVYARLPYSIEIR
ncbi:MAG: signal peptide peptidase SppA [Bacteroidales bacterium]|nr:signal peptide peptidase SppA [Bacteroidales bacterium]